jgi:diaminohydroxyphosphoribosylaminopyrimidine deaminase/5-amino-6-(5-phosphoribosylamino)uracil reductase
MLGYQLLRKHGLVLPMGHDIEPSRRDGLRRRESLADQIDAVWRGLLACRALSRDGSLAGARSLGFQGGELHALPDGSDPAALFGRDARGRWSPAPELDGEPRALAELYLPIATADARRAYLVGHLGQSLDGYIATADGDSNYVTGPENIRHLHRMRALCSAVVVGAGTVAADNPELTTRLVRGPTPARVILDPGRRLSAEHTVFTDSAAPTWLVCAEQRARDRRFGAARVLGVPVSRGDFDLGQLVARLSDEGLTSLFIEGGGDTVSRFLRAGLLDRLQVAVAAVLIGQGRPGLRLPARLSMSDCLRLDGRAFRMGRDVLFDCGLRDEIERGAEPHPGLATVY